MQHEKSIIRLYLHLLRLARDITTDFSREDCRRYSQVLTARDFLKSLLQYPSSGRYFRLFLSSFFADEIEFDRFYTLPERNERYPLLKYHNREETSTTT